MSAWSKKLMPFSKAVWMYSKMAWGSMQFMRMQPTPMAEPSTPLPPISSCFMVVPPYVKRFALSIRQNRREHKLFRKKL